MESKPDHPPTIVVVSLTYKAPLEQVNMHGAAHVAWLEQCLAVGTLAASGRKVPRTGGVLIVRGDLATAKAMCRNDPYCIHGMAEYEFTEVEVAFAASGLTAILNAHP
ncbi:MAG: YciI family protein [Acidovorax sp.]